ncbi:hypothetical protein PHMEG_00021750 [Phytophthora megakarya]|uniref:Jacalin-type lectin domain-containing protein n=1 Tax=Phytophthora megakarya TaxID=4795 RepID=A0A225VM04_9STRA|nr:hypothetical protein PHMEG_00021750 [Phytophthora megakarya]
MASPCFGLKEGVQIGINFGGPHGTKYTDVDVVSPQQTVQVIKIQAGERVDAVGIDYTDPTGLKTALYHGGRGGKDISRELSPGEYVTAMEVHWGEKGDHTRVKYIQFATNQGNTISGGNPTKNIGRDNAPEGYQLGGFYGTAGRELDSVGAVWTKVPGVTSAPAASVAIGMRPGNPSFNFSTT